MAFDTLCKTDKKLKKKNTIAKSNSFCFRQIWVQWRYPYVYSALSVTHWTSHVNFGFSILPKETTHLLISGILVATMQPSFWDPWGGLSNCLFKPCDRRPDIRQLHSPSWRLQWWGSTGRRKAWKVETNQMLSKETLHYTVYRFFPSELHVKS